MEKYNDRITAQKRRHNELGKLSTHKSFISTLQAVHEDHRKKAHEKVRLLTACSTEAGFRSGFSTNDHLQVIRSLIEKCNEYKIGIFLIFIGFEKAFDSVESWLILDSCK